MDAVIGFLNTIFWGYVLIYGLLAVGVYFTLRLGFLQFVHFPEFVRSVLHAPETDQGGITPVQALCTSLASRVGTGNLAGVAVALALGGPGAFCFVKYLPDKPSPKLYCRAAGQTQTPLPSQTGNQLLPDRDSVHMIKSLLFPPLIPVP